MELHVNRTLRLAGLGLCMSALGSAAASAAGIESVHVLEFGPGTTLFLGDTVGGAVHAVELSGRPAGPPQPAPFNIEDLAGVLADALDVGPQDVMVEDLAVHPVSGEAVVAVSRGAGGQPFLALIAASGAAQILDPAGMEAETLPIDAPPPEDLVFWGETPARSLSITDIDWHDGEILVSGLSSGAFASTLRRAPYPFDGVQSVASIEIYHTVHNQTETRSPIETLEVIEIAGEPHVLAVYTCTPVVVAPLSAFTDGAHVSGKTIAELGWGNTPIDLLSFEVDVPWMQGPHFLLTNRHRGAMLMSLADIVDHAGRPGLTEPVPFPVADHAGVPATGIAMGNVTHVADQGGPFILSVIRHKETGRLELGSRVKGLFLRISEFIDEYDMPDYDYAASSTPEWQNTYIRPARTQLMQVEGKADFAK